MNPIIILVRTESDFERAVCLGISAKKKYDIHFIFTGDFSPFFSDGISNKFQKELFKSSGFIIRDFCDYNFVASILKKLCGAKSIKVKDVIHNNRLILKFILFQIFKKYILFKKTYIIKKIYNKIKPSFLLTDQSMTSIDYLPEQFRVEAINMNIKVYLFTHGAAGGLHSVFSNPRFEAYNNYTVFVSNKNETNQELKNRIILGDLCSSYPYVNFLNSIDRCDISFHNDKKYRVAFMIGGTAAYTSTSGWLIQEEIIINLSENKDVAMILKVHPRDSDYNYLNMVSQFKNLLIVGNETDRSRVSKWANVVVCNDHCSTIFEPMILGKKVVAVEGKHLPKYKNFRSPLYNSSVNYISSSSEFNLESLTNSNPLDDVTSEIAWGSNGPIDLAFHIFDSHIEKGIK